MLSVTSAMDMTSTHLARLLKYCGKSMLLDLGGVTVVTVRVKAISPWLARARTVEGE
jgi:hypothetical protein